MKIYFRVKFNNLYKSKLYSIQIIGMSLFKEHKHYQIVVFVFFIKWTHIDK